jgi:UDP-galactopyranose mutase
VPWTRISEHKHFAPWEQHEDTVCFREYSKAAGESDIPYYPMRLEDDKSSLQRYVDAAEKTQGVSFIGRLGTYRYLDMHVVIGESLDFAKICLSKPMREWPTFSAPPLK